MLFVFQHLDECECDEQFLNRDEFDFELNLVDLKGYFAFPVAAVRLREVI